jgi:hypothetical protein
LILTCTVFVINGFSQEKKKVKVPSEVKTAFAAKFPNAQKVEWGIEPPGNLKRSLLSTELNLRLFMMLMAILLKLKPKSKKMSFFNL